MIRLCILTLALNFAALPVLAQQPNQLFTATRQQLDVAKVVLAQEDAWNKGDLNAYISYYKDAPDTQAVLGAPVRGLADIRSALRANFPNALSMGTLEQSDVQVRALGDDYALALGKYHLTRARTDGGDAAGSFTEIFEKTPDGWRVIFSENT